MKNKAFSLVELLVVCAVIGILASMLLPTLGSVKNKAKAFRAKSEMAAIVTACEAFQHEYRRPPYTRQSEMDATQEGHGGDLTYGIRAGWADDRDGDLYAILMDIEVYVNGQQTVNFGHKMNPRRIAFLNAKVESDGKYLDPWGTPYVVTLDANADDWIVDAIYGWPQVVGGSIGLKGLTKRTIDGKEFWALRGIAMVWSFGPDKKASLDNRADKGVNKDNVISW